MGRGMISQQPCRVSSSAMHGAHRAVEATAHLVYQAPLPAAQAPFPSLQPGPAFAASLARRPRRQLIRQQLEQRHADAVCVGQGQVIALACAAVAEGLRTRVGRVALEEARPCGAVASTGSAACPPTSSPASHKSATPEPEQLFGPQVLDASITRRVQTRRTVGTPQRDGRQSSGCHVAMSNTTVDPKSSALSSPKLSAFRLAWHMPATSCMLFTPLKTRSATVRTSAAASGCPRRLSSADRSPPSSTLRGTSSGIGSA